MNRRTLGADVLLLLTAAVWGFGFVAQRSGMQYIGPFAFNGIRFILGSFSLLPLIVWRKSRQLKTENDNSAAPKANQTENPWARKKTLFFSSLAAGTFLFFGVALQQLGMMATTAGNAGFITGLYVVLTPVFGIFLGRKTGKATWVGAVFTFTGLYFLSSAYGMSGSAYGMRGFNPGDMIIAISAIFWAFHVLIIDRLVQHTDPIELSAGQFAFTGLFALTAAFLLEPVLSGWLGSHITAGTSGLFAWKNFPALISGLSSGAIPFALVKGAIIPILYGGLGSVGIGYTLQVVAQRDAPPAHATIILCLEGCFAALGGILLLHEPIGVRTVLGFILMFTGMLVSQWELIRGQNA